MTAVLPDWARSGFSDAEPIAQHEVGHLGEIAAIIFRSPLVVPPPTDGGNKILWVSRQATIANRLDISAQRMDGTVAIGGPVQRFVDGGPGPSYVDLPQAGCWRLTLSWADRTDSLDLEYMDRPT